MPRAQRMRNPNVSGSPVSSWPNAPRIFTARASKKEEHVPRRGAGFQRRSIVAQWVARNINRERVLRFYSEPEVIVVPRIPHIGRIEELCLGELAAAHLGLGPSRGRRRLSPRDLAIPLRSAGSPIQQLEQSSRIISEQLSLIGDPPISCTPEIIKGTIEKTAVTSVRQPGMTIIGSSSTRQPARRTPACWSNRRTDMPRSRNRPFRSVARMFERP